MFCNKISGSSLWQAAFKKILLALALCFSTNLLLTSVASALDLDADGKADFVFITIAGNGSLVWRAQDLNDPSARNLGTFGSLGDQVAAGKWSGAKQQRAAISTTAKAQWTIDSIATFSMGAAGDRALSGVDLDGDGILDAITVSKSHTRYVWHVRSSKTSKIKSITLGSEGDMLVLLKKPKGGGAIGVVRKGSPYPTLYYVTTSHPKILSKVTFRASETLEKYAQATPITWASGETALAFSKKQGSGLKLVVVSLKTGKVLKRVTATDGNEITAGDYLGVGSDQIALQSKVGTLKLISKAGTQDIGINGSGIAVDEFNSNTLTKKSATPSVPAVSPTQVPATRTRPATPLNPSSCTLQDSTDNFGGFVWKPISDTQHFAVAVLPESFTGIVGRVDVWTKGGAYIKELPGKGAGNGNRTAWQDTALTGATYKARYGSLYVVGTNYSGGCSKWEIADPSRRVD